MAEGLKTEDGYRKCLGKSFSPHAPVSKLDHLLGRDEQLDAIREHVQSLGAAVIIYGERGVGKSSLAEVVPEYVESKGSSIRRIKASMNDGNRFSKVMKEVYIELLEGNSKQSYYEKNPPSFDDVNDMVNFLKRSSVAEENLLITLDEIDRMEGPEGRSDRMKIAAFVKEVGDNSSHFPTNVTVLLVGIADSIAELVSDHQSISRYLKTIRLPRMTSVESKQLIERGYQNCGITAQSQVIHQLVSLSAGVPHFVHLLAQQAGFRSVRRWASGDRDILVEIDEEDIGEGIGKAIEEVKDLEAKYLTATRSPQTVNRFADVLLACAFAKKDEFGFFRKADVEPPYQELTGNPKLGSPQFSSNIDELQKGKRGCVLRRVGESRQYRYRFADPMMETYVIIRAYRDGHLRLSSEELRDVPVFQFIR